MKLITISKGISALILLSAWSSEYLSIDGSNTVYPIVELVSYEYGKSVVNASEKFGIVISASGTGSGISKLCNNKSDIANASRKITDRELALCNTNGVKVLELIISKDAIVLVTNKSNKDLNRLSLHDLIALWGSNKQYTKWSDINPVNRKENINLYGSGYGAGNYYYLNSVLSKLSSDKFIFRSDYLANDNDNIISDAIVADNNAIGFISYIYYVSHKDNLKALAIENKYKKYILPSYESISNFTYDYLSRNLYIYVNKNILNRPKFFNYLKYILKHMPSNAYKLGYIPVDIYKLNHNIS